MKKSIPKWIKIKNTEQLKYYISDKKVKVLEKILDSYNNLEISDFDKYLLVQSFFNKFFYDLTLMEETNV